MGIESGSQSQLKRYNKSHTIKESIEAINILRSLSITIEIGFIMFDPLCTLNEIEENINYIITNNLTAHISAITNELKIYHKASYKELLDKFELKKWC